MPRALRLILAACLLGGLPSAGVAQTASSTPPGGVTAEPAWSKLMEQIPGFAGWYADPPNQPGPVHLLMQRGTTLSVQQRRELERLAGARGSTVWPVDHDLATLEKVQAAVNRFLNNPRATAVDVFWNRVFISPAFSSRLRDIQAHLTALSLPAVAVMPDPEATARPAPLPRLGVHLSLFSLGRDLTPGNVFVIVLNASDQPAQVTLDCNAVSFAVTTQAGEDVTVPPADTTCGGEIRLKLRPHETRRLPLNALPDTTSLPAGEYVLTGTVTLQGKKVSRSTRFALTQRD